MHVEGKKRDLKCNKMKIRKGETSATPLGGEKALRRWRVWICSYQQLKGGVPVSNLFSTLLSVWPALLELFNLRALSNLDWIDCLETTFTFPPVKMCLRVFVCVCVLRCTCSSAVWFQPWFSYNSWKLLLPSLSPCHNLQIKQLSNLSTPNLRQPVQRVTEYVM